MAKSFKSTGLAVMAQLALSKVRSVEYDDFGGVHDDLKDDSDAEGEDPREMQIQTPPPPKWFRYIGLMFAVLSSLVFSLTALLVKKLERFHPFSIALWRFQGALIPVLPLIIYKINYSEKKKSIFDAVYPLTELKKLRMFGLVMLRSVLSCNSLLFHFFSLKYLSMGDALTIASSTPIFVTVLARIFLKEKCGYVTGVASVLTLIGVVIITRPPHLTGAESFDPDTLIGSGLAFGCMFLAAISFTVLRYIRKVHYTVTTLMFGIWGGLENITLALIFNELNIPNTVSEWLYISGLALLTFVGQTAIILAMKFEQAGPVSIVRTCDVIFAYGIQIIILHSMPDKLSIIGASIVVFAVAVTGYRKWLKTLPEDNPTRRRMRFLLY